MNPSDFPRVNHDLAARMARLGAATVYEASGRRGQVDSAIRPLFEGAAVAGPAFTVECHPADNLMIHVAVALARPGDVLVVDGGGFVQAGAWGEILTVAAQTRGLAGLVMDGAVRDIRRIRELGFPVFARGVSIGSTTKLAPGRVATPVRCGGVVVRPGDLVLGDDDGVVVVPREDAEAVLQAAQRREEREREMIRELQAGALTLDLLGLRPLLRQFGLPEGEVGRRGD